MLTFTIFKDPGQHHPNPEHPGARRMWYVLDDGSGDPPLVYRLGQAATHNPFSADYCCAEGEPDYLDPGSDHPMVSHTTRISRKEFNLIKRMSEDMAHLMSATTHKPKELETPDHESSDVESAE